MARQAQVSIKTVSRAINNHPDVSDATRATIQEVARSLGFQPSSLARGLRSGHSGLIALLVPDILNPHYAEQAQNIQRAARATGHVLIISNTDYDAEIEMAEVQACIAQRVDGIISLTGRLDTEILRIIEEADIPHVGLRPPPGEEDDDEGMYLAMRYLITLGHRHFAYITETLDLGIVRARLNAFRHVLAAHGMRFEPGMVAMDAYAQIHKLEGGYRAINGMLDAGYRPSAVCTSSDLIAIGVLRAVQERGLRVPDDISIVGYDDILQASFTTPPLTTINISLQESAAYLVGELIRQIDADRGEQTPASPQTFAVIQKPQLRIRASTGPAPGTTF